MSKKIFWVDIPNQNQLGDNAEWVNVGTFDNREDAIKFIQENIDGNSSDGTIDLITEGLDE